MYAFDPRMHPYAQFPQQSQFAGHFAGHQYGYTPAMYPQAPQFGHAPSFENYYLLSRIEELRAQLHATNEMLQVVLSRRTAGEDATFAQPHVANAWYGQNYGHGMNYAVNHNLNHGAAYGSVPVTEFPYGVVPFQRSNATNAATGFNGGFGTGFAANENGPVRLRESDTHVYCDIFLPNLSMSDVEVEAVGNRIVARTRVPVAPMNRWAPVSAQLPKGFEFFEMPDGRVECAWLCHSAFQAKDVEATFREGFLCICITKTHALNHRHTIKVAKETMNRRAANETHS